MLPWLRQHTPPLSFSNRQIERWQLKRHSSLRIARSVQCTTTPKFQIQYVSPTLSTSHEKGARRYL